MGYKTCQSCKTVYETKEQFEKLRFHSFQFSEDGTDVFVIPQYDCSCGQTFGEEMKLEFKAETDRKLAVFAVEHKPKGEVLADLRKLATNLPDLTPRRA